VDRRPAANRDDVFISTNSLTKSYGLAGLRVGWMIAEPSIVERALRVRDVLDGVGSIPAEILGVLAFQQLDSLLERARGVLGPGQVVMQDFMASRPDLEWIRPIGGAVAFPRLRGVADAEPFVEMAADQFDVGVTPGRFFGAPEHFRVAVAGERSVLEGGLEALGKALDRGALRSRSARGLRTTRRAIVTSPRQVSGGWCDGFGNLAAASIRGIALKEAA